MDGEDTIMFDTGSIILNMIKCGILKTIDPDPLPTFHVFGNFPLEIRMKIWRMSMVPRIVIVALYPIGEIVLIERELTGLFCIGPVPASLHVCRESRTEALRFYKLCFGTAVDIESEDGSFELKMTWSPKAYFSYELDGVSFVYPNDRWSKKAVEGGYEDEIPFPLKCLPAVDRNNIRHISVHDFDIAQTYQQRELVEGLTKFPKIELVTIDVGYENLFKKSRMTELEDPLEFENLPGLENSLASENLSNLEVSIDSRRSSNSENSGDSDMPLQTNPVITLQRITAQLEDMRDLHFPDYVLPPIRWLHDPIDSRHTSR